MINRGTPEALAFFLQTSRKNVEVLLRDGGKGRGRDGGGGRCSQGGCRGDNQWQLRPLGYRRLLGLFVITLLVSDTHVTHPAYSVFPLRFLWTSLKTWRMLMMKTWLILMMSPNQELLLPESWDLKGREPTKNLDVVSRGAVNRRPAGPVFFLRPNRFRPLLTYLKTIYLSMTHPTLL